MRTIDLFSGCGGLTLGFEQAGFEVVAAFDFWEAAVNTYRLNFDHPIEHADLTDVAIQDKIKNLIQLFNYPLPSQKSLANYTSSYV